jgi:hypothetical protein
MKPDLKKAKYSMLVCFTKRNPKFNGSPRSIIRYGFSHDKDKGRKRLMRMAFRMIRTQPEMVEKCILRDNSTGKNITTITEATMKARSKARTFSKKPFPGVNKRPRIKKPVFSSNTNRK